MPIARLVLTALLASTALAAPAAAYFDVGKLPLPPQDGKALADSLVAFVADHSPRVTGTPQDEETATYLAAEATKLGYQATVEHPPVADGAPGPSPLHAVVAIKKGLTKPDEHIVFMGHYDTVAGFGGATLEGAYDNGSGTMLIRALAEAFARVPTNRSLMFVWYNGEEEGVLASDVHAKAAKEAGLKVRAALGFDMVGIAYPVATPMASNCLCMWHGEGDEALDPLLRHINFNVMGLPDQETLVEVLGVNQRNSDESSWDLVDYPTLRWAGMRTAASYPAYHMPDDTMATIDTVAGGRTFFEQGLRNTLVSSYLTALALDNEMPVAKATATPTGPGTAAFSAAGSSDPDGPLGTHTWHFGDGQTATGATVTHAYAKGGTYAARLDLSDNLWPGVTASVQVPVTVPALPVAAKKKAAKKKPSCRTKAKRVKNAKKRKRALKRCAKRKRG